MTYTYSCTKCGNAFDLVRPLADRAKPAECACGKQAARDMGAEIRSSKRGRCTTWPKVGIMSGVHPDQVPEIKASLKKAGVPTEFTAEGQPVYTGPKHFKEYCEARGLFDRNGGYGSPQTRDRR